MLASYALHQELQRLNLRRLEAEATLKALCEVAEESYDERLKEVQLLSETTFADYLTAIDIVKGRIHKRFEPKDYEERFWLVAFDSLDEAAAKSHEFGIREDPARERTDDHSSQSFS